MAHDKNEPGPANPWAAPLAPMANQIRSNLELMASINQIVARATQAMASRQSAVLTEAVADMTTLIRAAVQNPADPAVTSRACATYVEAMVQRGMAQLNFSVETIAEMSTSALDIAKKRMSSGAQAEPEPAPPRHTPHRK